MKKTLSLLAIITLMAASCIKEVAVVDVQLNKPIMNLYIGDTEELTAKILPENATIQTVSWKSSDLTIATVDNGMVTAIAEGVTSITVSTADGNKTATCEVTVIANEVAVVDVQLNKLTMNLYIGDTEELTAKILPENATNQTITWESNDPTIAIVDNGMVSAIAEGVTSITVTTADGNKTATCEVTVTEPPVIFEEPEMIFVEGGTFLYGCTDDECTEWDVEMGRYPPVEKTVKSFYIAKYPVTQKLWEDVMGTLPPYSSSYGKGDEYPVYNVSWANIWVFNMELRRITGKNYRLLSSEEWEYAARGGNKSEGYKYSGSNNIDEVAWYSANSGGTTHPVGTKAPNELGIYDMSGNVCEWLFSDFFPPSSKPQMYEHRGGSWDSSSLLCRVSGISGALATSKSPSFGFRLALSVE